MDDSCLFCRIIRKEIKAEILYEDERFLVIRDIHPIAPAHVLLIPKVHIPDLNAFGRIPACGTEATEGTEEPEKAMAGLFALIARIARDLGLADDGYRIMINCGPHGGQTIPHLHLHLVGGKALRWIC